ncbi:recombinase family protein [Chryseobacterium sp. SIMBA_029]|uniref:recombinase family protein n=2 Tax=Bacteria TaxID=2 RepID=UPI003979996E
MKTADLYIRVSTDEQADKGYSQRDQLERLERYCKQNDLTVGQTIFEDHSAKNFNRPEWAKYISYIKKRSTKSDFVLFTKWDRFSRNAGDAYQMIKLLENHNISPQAIEQPLDTSIPENKMMLAIYLAAPEVENDRRALNTFFGMRRAQKEGRVMGTASYGYINKCTEDGRKYIAIKEPEASNMRWAFNELSKGKYAIEQIRKKMNSMEGADISRSSFYNSIRNPVYCGKVFIKAYKEEEECIVEGKHESLISEFLFIKVQQVLNGKTREERPQGKIQSLEQLPLRGFLKCPRCGEHISGSGSKGKLRIYYYYHCNSKCGYRHNSKIVNLAFEEQLKNMEFNDGAKQLLKEIILYNFKHIQKNVDDKKKDLSKQIQVLNKKLDSAREKYLNDMLDYEDYQLVKSDTKMRLDNLEIALHDRKLTRKNLDIKQKIDNALHVIPNLSKLYAKGDTETKRSILCSILAEKLEFEENAFRTPKLNSALDHILYINRKLRDKKDEQSIQKNALSVCVTAKGFEPPTLRAEI